MNLRSTRRYCGLTRVDTIILVATVAALLLVTLAGMRQMKQQVARKTCQDNLSKICLAFRQWTLPSGDLYPMGVPMEMGGSAEAVTNGPFSLHFLVMSNELKTPKLLVCPTDSRKHAGTFASGFANENISYFIGLDAYELYPDRLLAGDRNLEVDGLPCGSGLTEVTTNRTLGWTAAMHNRRGNVALGGGSVQGLTSVGLQEAALRTGLATNRFAIP